MANTYTLTGYQLRYRVSGITDYSDYTPERLVDTTARMRDALRGFDVLKISFYFKQGERDIMIQYRQDDPGTWEFFNWENLAVDEFNTLCSIATLMLGSPPTHTPEEIDAYNHELYYRGDDDDESGEADANEYSATMYAGATILDTTAAETAAATTTGTNAGTAVFPNIVPVSDDNRFAVYIFRFWAKTPPVTLFL